jgi:hypothetical protein
MKNKTLVGAGCALLFLSIGASAGTVPLNTNNYNFALAGGGGGSTATLNGLSVETFCENFADEIYVPGSYLANVTTLGTSADLSNTRFGGVSSTDWTTISLTSGNSTIDTTDDTFFNSGKGSSAMARYDMAAYLVSLYDVSQGNTTANNQIQEAIWTIMDPTEDGTVINPANVNPSGYLNEAANWYSTMDSSANQAALNTFVSHFEIVSPSDMTFTAGLGIGGFQEQIVMTPEPRGESWMLLGLLLSGFFVVQLRGRTAAAGRLAPVNVS